MAWSFSKAFKNLFSGARQVEPQDWEDLEDTLLQADFGPLSLAEPLVGSALRRRWAHYSAQL
jgi:fused signal recognition particle receptor